MKNLFLNDIEMAAKCYRQRPSTPFKQNVCVVPFCFLIKLPDIASVSTKRNNGEEPCLSFRFRGLNKNVWCSFSIRHASRLELITWNHSLLHIFFAVVCRVRGSHYEATKAFSQREVAPVPYIKTACFELPGRKYHTAVSHLVPLWLFTNLGQTYTVPW